MAATAELRCAPVVVCMRTVVAPMGCFRTPIARMAGSYRWSVVHRSIAAPRTGYSVGGYSKPSEKTRSDVSRKFGCTVRGPSMTTVQDGPVQSPDQPMNSWSVNASTVSVTD